MCRLCRATHLDVSTLATLATPNKSALFKTTQAISLARRQLDWQRALCIFGEYTRATQATGAKPLIEMPLINTTITACEVGTCWQLALDLARQAEQLQLRPTAFTLTSLMSVCRRGRQWQKALQFFRSVDQLGVAVDAGLLGIAIACAATGHLWTYALDILASAQGSVALTSAAENAGILACEKGRQWEMALSLLAKMQASTECRAGRAEKISLITVNSVLSACEKARQWRHALSLLQKFSVFKLQPDTISINVAIGAFAAGRHWEEAMRHFHYLCRSGHATHTTHTTTLSSCERAMRWEDALQMVLSWPFNSQSSEVAAIAAARAGRWQEALLLVQGHFGWQQLIQSGEQSGCWGRPSWHLQNSAGLVETMRRWKVKLPEFGEVELQGVGKHSKILMHPGTAPSNAIWCLTARDWLEGVFATPVASKSDQIRVVE